MSQSTEIQMRPAAANPPAPDKRPSFARASSSFMAKARKLSNIALAWIPKRQSREDSASNAPEPEEETTIEGLQGRPYESNDQNTALPKLYPEVTTQPNGVHPALRDPFASSRPAPETTEEVAAAQNQAPDQHDEITPAPRSDTGPKDDTPAADPTTVTETEVAEHVEEAEQPHEVAAGVTAEEPLPQIAAPQRNHNEHCWQGHEKKWTVMYYHRRNERCEAADKMNGLPKKCRKGKCDRVRNYMVEGVRRIHNYVDFYTIRLDRKDTCVFIFPDDIQPRHTIEAIQNRHRERPDQQPLEIVELPRRVRWRNFISHKYDTFRIVVHPEDYVPECNGNPPTPRMQPRDGVPSNRQCMRGAHADDGTELGRGRAGDRNVRIDEGRNTYRSAPAPFRRQGHRVSPIREEEGMNEQAAREGTAEVGKPGPSTQTLDEAAQASSSSDAEGRERSMGTADGQATQAESEAAQAAQNADLTQNGTTPRSQSDPSPQSPSLEAMSARDRRSLPIPDRTRILANNPDNPGHTAIGIANYLSGR